MSTIGKPLSASTETTYGQDIDSFVLEHCYVQDQKIASIKLQRIVLKALQVQLKKLVKKFSTDQ